MPKDKRLYMTLTIEFPEHPKVEPLSDAAFRAFIEMNCYSRRVDSDGFIPKVIAEKRWSRKTLTELLSSHHEKPLVILDGDGYVIREYAQHQETRASREERVAKLRENGAKGGRPRNQVGNQNKTKLVFETNQAGYENETKNITKIKAEIEQESELENTHLNLESYVNSRASNFLTQDEVGEMRVRKGTYESLGIKEPLKIQSALVNALSRDVNELETFRIVVDIMAKAPGLVKSPQAYVLAAVRSSWAELQKQFDDGLFGGAA